MHWIRRLGRLIPLVTITLGAGCSAPAEDGSELGKKITLDAVDLALSVQDCATAVAKIEPLYNSASTDNDVRLRAASAYGCHAGINFFQLVSDIASRGSVLTGSGFWSSMAELFPSTTGADYKVEGALSSIAALQSALKSGALVLDANQINPTSFNVGSVFATDRISDANIYLIFASMAAIGSLENRHGVSNSSDGYRKTRNLPWTTATSADLDTDGCAFASAIVNLIDAIGEASSAMSGNASNSLRDVHASLQTSIDNACALGCAGIVPPGGVEPNPRGDWVNNGCGLSTACSECPDALRDRTKCQKLATDQVSCAASGLVNLINSSEAVGWLGNSADTGWVGP